MSKKEQHSRQWIAADDEFEIRYWARRLQISQDELKQIVAKAGGMCLPFDLRWVDLPQAGNRGTTDIYRSQMKI